MIAHRIRAHLLSDPVKVEGISSAVVCSEEGLQRSDEPLPGALPPTGVVPRRLPEALLICVTLAALGPQPSAEQFVAAGVERIASSLNADGGHFGLARRRQRPEADPLLGFRLDVYYGFGSRFSREIQRADQLLQSEVYVHDPGIQLTAREAGRHRIYHDPDPRTQPSRVGSIDRQSWELFGLVDRLKLVYSLSPDLELHFAFDRGPCGQRFEVEDVALLEVVAGGLEPWAQRAAWLHGCLLGHTLLSAGERALACALLGNAPLKSIAGTLGISEARAREVARSVYRKLAVSGRLGLASAWAGSGGAGVSTPISRALRRRRN